MYAIHNIYVYEIIILGTERLIINKTLAFKLSSYKYSNAIIKINKLCNFEAYFESE